MIVALIWNLVEIAVTVIIGVFIVILILGALFDTDIRELLSLTRKHLQKPNRHRHRVRMVCDPNGRYTRRAPPDLSEAHDPSELAAIEKEIESELVENSRLQREIERELTKK